MAAGFVDITVTTKTGTDITFHCWVPDTGSPAVGAIPLRMATDASGNPIDVTHPMFAQLIASTAAIGKLAANAGVNIGTVTVDAAQVGTLGPAAKAGSISVTRATDEGSLPTKDDGPNWTTVWGVAGVPFTSSDQHSAAASVTDAPTSGQHLVIDDLIFSTDTAMNVTLKCETSGAVIAGPFYVPANFVGQLTPRGKGQKLATADKKLQVITSVAGNIMVLVGYHSEA